MMAVTPPGNWDILRCLFQARDTTFVIADGQFMASKLSAPVGDSGLHGEGHQNVDRAPELAIRSGLGHHPPWPSP